MKHKNLLTTFSPLAPAAEPSHMVFGTHSITDADGTILLRSFGSFRHPDATTASLLRKIGYYALSEEVTCVIETFKPRDMSSDRWARIRALVQDAASVTIPLTTGSATTIIRTAAYFVEWAVFIQHIPMEGEAIWVKPLIDHYVTNEFSHLSEGTRRNYRRYLEIVRQAVRPSLEDYEYTPQNRKSHVAPYTDEEMMQHRKWAAAQNTILKKQRAMLMLIFCAGAGLRPTEIGPITHSEIHQTSTGYVIEVEGSFPRRVPLLSLWHEWLEVLLEELPQGQTLWGMPNRSRSGTLLSSFTQYSKGTPPRGDRLRNTWIVTHLKSRVPMKELFYAAGVSKLEHLNRLIAHIPPLETQEYESIFTGGSLS